MPVHIRQVREADVEDLVPRTVDPLLWDSVE